MGYIFLLIALIAGTTKGFLGKKLSNTVVTHRQSVFVNLIRMILCIVISIGVLLVQSGGFRIVIDIPALIFGSMAGVTLSVFTVTWLMSMRHGVYMLVSVAQTFGMVITLVGSFLVFREKIGWQQILGVGILIAAVLVTASYSRSQKGRLTVKAVILLILCGVSCGLYDFSQKLFTAFSTAEISTLNLLTYIAAAMVLFLFFMISEADAQIKTKELFRKTIWNVMAASVCLFVNSYFMALSTRYLTATQLYPVSRAGGMIAAALMSAIFFGEKITLRCVAGISLSFIAILLLK